MGYPNPAESPYDLFMTGHAGAAPSTALGLHAGDILMGQPEPLQRRRHRRRRLPLGRRLRGAEQRRRPARTASDTSSSSTTTRCRSAPGSAASPTTSTRPGWPPSTAGPTSSSARSCRSIPLVGDQADRLLQQFKDAVKASFHGGMLFEELGFTYLGPIDGHDLKTLQPLPGEGQGDGGADPPARPDRQGPRLRAGRAATRSSSTPRPPSSGYEDGIIPLKTSSHPRLHQRRLRRPLRRDGPRPPGSPS